MFRSVIASLGKLATGASKPRRAIEIAPEILPGAIMDKGSVSFHKVSAGKIDAATEAAGAADIDFWVLPHANMQQFLDGENVLSADELAKADTIVIEERRVRFIAVRSLLRRALSHRVRDVVKATDWRFATNAYGKPELVDGQADVSFSITHAEGFSVIAIAESSTVGIDAERVDASRISNMPVELLSQNEQQSLKAQSSRGRYRDFFRIWTLKEAYTKALGKGMSLDFSKIDFCAQTARLKDEAADALFGVLSLKYLEQKYLLTVCMLGASLASLVASKKSFFIVEAAI